METQNGPHWNGDENHPRNGNPLDLVDDFILTELDADPYDDLFLVDEIPTIPDAENPEYLEFQAAVNKAYRDQVVAINSTVDPLPSVPRIVYLPSNARLLTFYAANVLIALGAFWAIVQVTDRVCSCITDNVRAQQTEFKTITVIHESGKPGQFLPLETITDLGT